MIMAKAFDIAWEDNYDNAMRNGLSEKRASEYASRKMDGESFFVHNGQVVYFTNEP